MSTTAGRGTAQARDSARDSGCMEETSRGTARHKHGTMCGTGAGQRMYNRKQTAGQRGTGTGQRGTARGTADVWKKPSVGQRGLGPGRAQGNVGQQMYGKSKLRDSAGQARDNAQDRRGAADRRGTADVYGKTELRDSAGQARDSVRDRRGTADVSQQAGPYRQTHRQKAYHFCKP